MFRNLPLPFLLLAFLPVAHSQITIEVVGDGSGYDILGTDVNEAAAFRSMAVPKSFDSDGDHAYGTEGVLLFGNGGGKAIRKPFSFHTQVGAEWATFYKGGNFKAIAQNLDLGPMDDPTASIALDVENWKSLAMLFTADMGGANSWGEIVKIDISAAAPQQFRIGLVSGIQAFEDGRWDPVGLRVTADDGLTFAMVTELENNGGDDANFVFFDVDLNGATSGTFAIWGQQRLKSKGTTLTGITFDRISESKGEYVDIPEPSGYGLLLGCVALTAVCQRQGKFRSVSV